MPTTPDETAQAAAAAAAAEEEAKKQQGIDLSPVGDAAAATVDGTLSAVLEGVGDLAQGAAELVGGVLGGLADL